MILVGRKTGFAAAVFALVACCSPCPAAVTYFVRAGGSDQASGTSPQAAFRTVLHAAGVLNHGDTVIVGPGVYRESLLIAERFGTVPSPLSLIGDETGRQTGDLPGPVVLEAGTEQPAVHLSRVRDVLLSSLTFRGTGEGLRLENCRSARVERCTFLGLARGACLSSCQGVRLESTVFQRCTIGLQVRQSAALRVAHATVAGCSSVGLFLAASSQGTIRNSIFVGNNTSMVADDVSAASWTSDHNVLTGTTGAWGPVPGTYNPYEWFAASGQDRHSRYVAPAFVDPGKGDLHVDAAVAWGGGLPGLCAGTILDPEVKLDRDGHPFTVREGAVCTGAYEYPAPRQAPGWRSLGIRLSPGGPRQSAALFRPDGQLVRTLLADVAGVARVVVGWAR